MADMLLKGVPERIKAWIADQAKAHGRSIPRRWSAFSMASRGEGAFLEGFLRCDRLLGYPISRKGVPSLARSAGDR